VTIQGATQCDVQEHLLLPSRQSSKRTAVRQLATSRSNKTPVFSRSKRSMS